MKRLGLPLGKEIQWSRFFAASLFIFSIAGCGSKMGPVGGSTDTSTTGTQDTGGLLGTDSNSSLDGDSSNIVQGAYDQSSQDLSNTTAPGSVGTLSQQQTACTSASSSSSQMDFFSQISQPNFYGSSSACFANQINPQQLLAQAYTFYSTMAQCQAIALNQVRQIEQTQQNLLALTYWATGFILECAQRATMLESSYAYAAPLANGISIRSQALRSSSNRIRIAIQQRAGH